MSGKFGVQCLPNAKERQKNLLIRHNISRTKRVFEDADNIGARLLAKQGWTEGKGLGKLEDGMTDPIAVRFKKDTEGVGFTGLKDDQWTQHDAGFNELLKQLNGEKDLNCKDDSNAIDATAQLQSLEESSKKSRARVHYKKFTRGKDLTRANEKDLANIFGKRSLAELNKPVETMQKEVSTSESENNSESEDRTRNVLGLTTIKSKLSVQDYFKDKMKQKKLNTGQTELVEDDTQDENVDDVETNIKKKMKKSKQDIDSRETSEENAEGHDSAETDSAKPRKIKKKSKESKPDPMESNGNASQEAERFNDAVPSETIVILEENDAEDVELAAKASIQKDKRKHEIVQVVTEDTECTEPRKKKKKSKKLNPLESVTNGKEESVEIVDVDEVQSETLKKKKKSKKNKSANDQSIDNTSTELPRPIEEALEVCDASAEKKKKTKKSKSSLVDPAAVTVAEVESPTVRPDPAGKDVAENDNESPSPIAGEEEEEEDVTCRVKVEILKHLDEMGFPGSNFGNIVGYRLTEDVKLIKKEGTANRFIERHRFHVKTETVSDHRKLQKLKKVQAFTSV